MTLATAANLSEPEGPLMRFLGDPQGWWRGCARALGHAIWQHRLLLLVGAFVAVGSASVLQRLVKARARAAMQGARRIRVLPAPEIDPESARLLWTGLHSLLRPWWSRLALGQPWISWEISALSEDIAIEVWVPRSIPADLVERAIEVAFPGTRTTRSTEDCLDGFGVDHTQVCELGLAERAWFPIAPAPGAHPMALALASLSGLRESEGAAIQVLARPATIRSRGRLRRAARLLRTQTVSPVSPWTFASRNVARRPSVDPAIERDVRTILDKSSGPAWECVVRVATRAPSRELARARIHALAGAFAVFEGRNGFRRRRVRGVLSLMRARALRRPYLLSVPELAQLATLPGAGTLAGLESAGSRTVAPTRRLPTTGRVLGVADHTINPRPVAIAVPDGRHHFHVVGETGTGKSTLLAQMVLQDVEASRAAVVIDPKGDLVEEILRRLPAGAEDRTCLIDPQDKQWAVGLNVLAGEDHDLVVDHVIGVFKRIYEQWWGPRTDDIMRAACLTLAQIPGATLAEVPLLLSNFEWRREIRAQLSDGVGLGPFWAWYDKLPEQQRSQHIAPLLNKLRAFLLRGPVRAVVGQASPKREIETLLDQGGLILVRVPKGTLGEETSRLLGALVIARVWQAAMARATRDESERADCALYVDEMHNYLALPRSFEDLLAEARGYRLSLILAHQHLGQLPKEMRDALGANARTKIVFACSPEDATQLEKHFGPDLSDHDLSHLVAFQAACRPCVEGGQAQPFTFRTLPLHEGSPERARVVRQRSAELFATARADVEAEISDRHSKAERVLRVASEPRTPSRSAGQSRGSSAGQSGEQSSLPEARVLETTAGSTR